VYTPKQFEERDLDEMRAIMRAYPFVTMITLQEGEPWVSHLPILYDDDGSPYGELTGHMARANRQWRHLAGGQTALIIFHGPHRYISPSWYITKPNVPTWNYATVHARGKARMIEDDDTVHAILERTVAHFEAGSREPWTMQLPQDFLDVRYPKIVGFEIPIESLEGKFKLNQNREDVDRRAVIARLREEDDPGSREMLEIMLRLDQRLR